MVVVAVAGGTGHLGQAIVEVLKENPKHKVIVLGRKAPEKTDPDAPALVVDYSDIEGTAQLLADNDVHTVISTILVTDETGSTAQINLIKAATKSAATKRFIASDWGIEHSEESPMYSVREAAFNELRKTDLEWTRFVNGYFLDYYGIPYVKTHLGPGNFALDIASKMAGIPGTGNETMTFTYTFDVAKFVAAFLDMPKWEETTYCYGDKTTWNEFVKLAEEARGSKFTVTYDPIEKLQRGEITELPSHQQLYPFLPKPMLQGFMALFGRYVVEGKFDLPTDKSLNEKFPEIQTMKVKDIAALWKGK